MPDANTESQLPCADISWGLSPLERWTASNFPAKISKNWRYPVHINMPYVRVNWAYSV